mgnify:CR=1 FL=1
MDLQPTQEQQSVLDAPERLIKINARAGTGKTSTLLMLAKKYAKARILYLVYNKKAQTEARSTFPGNVTVHTVHSLAYRSTPSKRHQRGWKPIVDFTPAGLLPEFEEFNDKQHELASMSYNFLTYYLNSPTHDIEKAAGQFADRHLSKTMIELFKPAVPSIIDTFKKIFESWRERGECVHDYYLKLFHKTGNFLLQLNQYDIILVDEGQDLSPIMSDVLSKCDKKVILVGDPHQQIYRFRYAVDAMQTHSSDVNLELSMSFRFGTSVAETVSKLITEAKNEKEFSIQGNSQVKSTVSFYRDRDLLSIVQRFKGIAILSRTNLNLFTKAIQLRKDGIPFIFERDVTPQMLRTLDVYWLSLGDNEKIRDPFIKSFKTLDHLEHHASEMDDREFSQMAKVVRDYVKDLPNIIFDLIKIHKDNTQKANTDAVILSTIHSSKGQEYDHVIIGSDLPYFLSEDTEQEEETFLEEVNIAYVALTRVKQQLFLPTDFKTLFNREWQDYISKFKSLGKSTKISSHTSKSLRRKQRQTPIIEDSAKRTPGPTKKISNGSRVRVANGEGIVIDINPNKCLINLDSQEANVWEEIRNINLI